MKRRASRAPGKSTTVIKDAVPAELTASTRKALVKYAVPPLAFLPSFLSGAFLLSTIGIFSYTVVMPLLLFIMGVVVMFIGAFWDFGAKMYVQDLVDHSMPFGDEDLEYVFRQQFILTMIYICIGLLYLAAAFVIFLI